MKGNAVIVYDPHDDLAEEVVAELPQARIADTHILDLRDEEFPFGVNMFSLAGKLTTEEERTQAIERILHIFDVLWPDVLKQQHLPMMLRCAVIALLERVMNQRVRARRIEGCTDAPIPVMSATKNGSSSPPI
jgi:hypothetical protein